MCVCAGSAQGCGTQRSAPRERGGPTPDEGGSLGADAKLLYGDDLGVMCRDTRLYIDDYRCLGGFGSMVVCWGGFVPGLRVFLASLAVDLASRADRSMPPVWCGPSCLDIESDAPLTGDRTGVSGG